MPCLHEGNVKFLCSVHNIAIAAVVSLSGGSVRWKWPLRMPLYRCKMYSKKCDICSISNDVHFHKKASLTISYGINVSGGTVHPKKYAHGFFFVVLCCGYTLTDFPISTRLTSLALWQSNDCPSASKATLMNMDKYFMWIHYERLHNHNKAKHNKTVCIFLGIYCNLGMINYSCLYPWHTCKNDVLLHCNHKGRFPLPVPSQSWEIMGNKKTTNFIK